MKIWKSKLTQTLTVVAILSLSSCATVPYQGQARDVKKRPGDGGTVAMQVNNRPEDRTKAEQLMASTCGTKKVKVMEEGEVVIGQTTTETGKDSYSAGKSEHKTGSFLGMDLMSGGEDPSVNKNTVTKTTAEKEWQITYVCKK